MKTVFEDQVERVARTFYEGAHGENGGRWDLVDDRYKEFVWRAGALAVIADLCKTCNGFHSVTEPHVVSPVCPDCGGDYCPAGACRFKHIEAAVLPVDAREALVWIRDQGAGDTVGVYDRARFLARRLLS
jgi:hypothetical protein